jgi:VCBS repeat-containing protein
VTTAAGDTETATVNVTVNAVVDVADDSITTNEDTAGTINVLTNDSFGAGATVTSVTNGTNGTVAFLADGTVTYTPSTDFNGSDSFTYTVTTAAGDTETATVNVTVNAVNDAPVGLPLITGTVEEDQTLTADTSGISDADGLGAFSYQWLRNGVAIGGATGSTYALGDADVGTQISVQVSYIDGQGTAEGPLTSAQTAPVANVNDAPTGSVLIDNLRPDEGDTLTASNTLVDIDGISGAISYQWYRDGVPISGASATNYTTVQADVDAVITVVASYTDDQGTVESVSSADTRTVKHARDPGDADGNITEFPTDEDDPVVVEPEAVTIDLSKDESTVGYLADIGEEGNAGHNELFIVPDYDNELYQDEPRTASFLGHVFKPLIEAGHDLTEEMLQLFDLVRIKVDEISEQPGGMFSNPIGNISLSLSVGLVTWVMRGGSIAVSLMSSMTMLNRFDPMPLIGTRRKDKKENSADGNSEDAQVDDLFDGDEGKTRPGNTGSGEKDQS